MVIAVAERLHVRVRPELLEFLREYWSPTAYAWSAAFLEGATRTRWRAMGGDHVDRAANLLWPSGRVGDWDPLAARRHADRLLEVAGAKRHSLVLLGRRVEAAFGLARALWGTIRDHRGVSCLILPHPSGRSRVLNDPERRAAMRQALVDFCAYERGRRILAGSSGSVWGDGEARTMTCAWHGACNERR